jgi:hypothetical protein
MRKLLIYYSFIIVSVMVVIGFLSASTLPQLAVAILFFPLFIYFASRVFPRKTHAIQIPVSPAIKILAAGAEGTVEKVDPQVVKLKKEGVDIDRRTFLKLIGSAGVSLFLFSLFTKRAEAAFFGSVPGPGTVSIKDSAGNKIDPAERQPTDGYKISEVDDDTPAYYGFINKDGGWYIMKETDTGSYLYVRGDTDFSGNWSTHDTREDYDTFDQVF